MRVDEAKLRTNLDEAFDRIEAGWEKLSGKTMPEMPGYSADQFSAMLRDQLTFLGLDPGDPDQLRSAAAGAFLMVGWWEAMGAMFDMECCGWFRHYCKTLMSMADDPVPELKTEEPRRRRWRRG